MTQKLRWTKIDLGLRSANYVTPLVEPVTIWNEEATHVCRWYNRDERSWVVSLSDAQGNQVGSSEYVYSRDDAEFTAQALINQYTSDDVRIDAAMKALDAGDPRPVINLVEVGILPTDAPIVATAWSMELRS